MWDDNYLRASEHSLFAAGSSGEIKGGKPILIPSRSFVVTRRCSEVGDWGRRGVGVIGRGAKGGREGRV